MVAAFLLVKDSLRRPVFIAFEMDEAKKAVSFRAYTAKINCASPQHGQLYAFYQCNKILWCLTAHLRLFTIKERDELSIEYIWEKSIDV